jgi:hypothetical protein
MARAVGYLKHLPYYTSINYKKEKFMPEQNCPLCEALAKYEPVDFGRKKYFNCPNCKSFVITPTPEKLISELPLNSRADFSNAASVLDENNILFIALNNENNIFSRVVPKSNWS